MFFEPYNERKHGRIGVRSRLSNDAWEAMFRAALDGPVVVRGTQRQTIHYAAERLGYRARVQMLSDCDGYAVTATRIV